MAIDTRSSVLYAGVAAAVAETILTAPAAGYVQLVKTVQFTAASSTSSRVAVSLARPAGAVTVSLIDTTIAEGQVSFWSGWHVLEPGDRLTAYCWTAPVRIWVSGTNLRSDFVVRSPFGELSL